MDQLLAIKDRAWEKFRLLPGVHAVGIGKKVTGGIRTDETVLTVFVTNKRPLHELPSHALVPSVFEGVRTDVIERPMPQSMDGPISVTEAVIPNGKSFTFTTTVDPPPNGTRIVITVTWHGAEPDKVFIFVGQGDGASRLDFILSVLQARLTGPFFTATLTGTTLAITTPAAGESMDASCYVLLADRKAYAHEYLRGGILIQGGSKNTGGTLGCLATLPADAQHPNGRIVGVTCSHVVREYSGAKPLLHADSTGGATIDLKLVGAIIPAHSAITAIFVRQETMQASVFYQTSAGESLKHVADGLAAEISRAGLPGVSATATLLQPKLARVNVVGFGGSTRIDCSVQGPAQFPGNLQLRAHVVKTPTGEHIVSFDGSVSSPDLGVFVDIDSTGFAVTFGIYHNPPKNQRLQDLAQAISTAINLSPASQRGLVSAMAVGDKVTISQAKYVRVWVEPDIRIGQPIDFYQSHTAPCCNFRIGRVLEARLDIDVALIQFDAGLKYKHHIEELNAVAGTQTPLPGLAVQKRGVVTGITEGMVSAIAMSGLVGSGGLTRVFHNAAAIDSTILDTGGLTHRAFALPGDSGAAVVTTGAGIPKLAGMLFGGGIDGNAMMTPIDQVVSGFSHLGLAFDPGIGVDLSAVHTVPANTMNLEAADEDDRRLVNGADAARPLAGFADRIHEVGQQIASTSVGREYTAAVRRHFGEALDLVNQNPRVATVWHRSGGPELLNALLRVLRFDDEPLPREINGRPLAECLLSLRKIFSRYADPQLSRELGRLTALLTKLAGMTYPQMLATLRTESGRTDAG